MHTVGVLAGDDGHLRGGVWADAVGSDQGRGESLGQLGQNLLVAADFGVQLLPSAGDCAQRVLRRGQDGVDLAGPQTRAPLDQGAFGQSLQLLRARSGRR